MSRLHGGKITLFSFENIHSFVLESQWKNRGFLTRHACTNQNGHGSLKPSKVLEKRFMFQYLKCTNFCNMKFKYYFSFFLLPVVSTCYLFQFVIFRDSES